jgi:hypothetical protein
MSIMIKLFFKLSNKFNAKQLNKPILQREMYDNRNKIDVKYA